MSARRLSIVIKRTLRSEGAPLAGFGSGAAVVGAPDGAGAALAGLGTGTAAGSVSVAAVVGAVDLLPTEDGGASAHPVADASKSAAVKQRVRGVVRAASARVPGPVLAGSIACVFSAVCAWGPPFRN